MTTIEFTRLLERFEQGMCSPDEQQRLEQWLDAMPEGSSPFPSADEQERVKLALLMAIHQKIRPSVSSPAHQSGASIPVRDDRKLRTNWPAKRLMWRFAAAASVLIVLSLGIYGYLNNGQSPDSPFTVARSEPDIAPGGNRATLTLADGSVILLTDAKNGTLAQQGSTAIRKTGTGVVLYDLSQPRATDKLAGKAYNTITVPRGGQYRVVLSDGTLVWLNAASSLRYPAQFAGHERIVELTGEAYFEVAPNKNKPFHVKTATQDVTVLGTHFNVNAYTDEPAVKTTLLEGSVQVTQAGVSQRLRPGQQAGTTASGREISVQAVDADDAVAWKNGLFRFRQADIKTVMRQLARWYDVEVAYEGQLPDRAYTGEIYRNVQATQVLEMLSYSTVHFRVETGLKGGNPTKTIIVMP